MSGLKRDTLMMKRRRERFEMKRKKESATDAILIKSRHGLGGKRPVRESLDHQSGGGNLLLAKSRLQKNAGNHLPLQVPAHLLTLLQIIGARESDSKIFR